MVGSRNDGAATIDHPCRICSQSELKVFLDLGDLPIADALVTEAMLGEADPRFPLQVAFCPNCSLVQILETLPPEVLFCRDYPYFSSVSDYWLEHSRQHAAALTEQRQLAPDSLVIEVGSNDGYLLRYFMDRGISVLGIDPADGPAEAARARGIDTLGKFFGSKLADELKHNGIQGDIVVANNVVAHVADTPDFIRGLRTLIKPDGLISIEVPYIRDLIDKGEFDTIYHQHLYYFSLAAIVALLETAGLIVQDVFRLPSHGGSLRVYAGRDSRRSGNVTRMLNEEHEVGLDRFDYYTDFSEQVRACRNKLVAYLHRRKRADKRIVGYGAAAKACTLLNYCGIGTETLDHIVDRNPHKHGLFMPGVRIPIKSPNRLLEEQPDEALMLCWNLAAEVLHQQREYLDRGGRFIIPLPDFKIIRQGDQCV